MPSPKCWAIQWDNEEKSVTYHHSEEEAKLVIAGHHRCGGSGVQTIHYLTDRALAMEEAARIVGNPALDRYGFIERSSLPMLANSLRALAPMPGNLVAVERELLGRVLNAMRERTRSEIAPLAYAIGALTEVLK